MKQLSDMHISIQELERERDEVMNAIEMQIENVMVNILDDPSELGSVLDGERPNHVSGATAEPGQSPSAWKHPMGSRPRRGTGDTARTAEIAKAAVSSSKTARRLSVNTKTSSIRDPTKTLDHRLMIKSEKMAEKMASIQRKVSLFLAVSIDRFFHCIC